MSSKNFNVFAGVGEYENDPLPILFPSEILDGDKYGFDPNNLSQYEIEYEIDVHDCGLNPYCTSLRSCGNDVRPLPSPEKLEKLKILYAEKLREIGFDEFSIQKAIKEHWGI